MSKSYFLSLPIIILFLISCNSSNYLIVNEQSVETFKVSSNEEKSEDSTRMVETLLRSADGYLIAKIKGVLDKKIIPPSGDKHDYISYAIYYWPNSEDPDLPWVYKDGMVNEKNLVKTDHMNYYNMLSALKTLSVAYYISNETKYAKKAAGYIRNWFIEDSTKINPNFRYAQGIPNKTSGTPSGIIDTRGLIWVIDAVNLISDSNALSKDEVAKFKEWISQYLNWLTKSEFALREFKATNNHGTFYDLQKLAFADYIGNDSLALSAIESIKVNRIQSQIKPDGSQPLELARVKDFHYSLFNLIAFVQAAMLAEKYDVNLWTYSSKNSGSIIDAIKYMALSLKEGEENPFEEKEIDYRYYLQVLLKAKQRGFNQFSEIIPQVRAKVKNVYMEEMFFFN